MQRAIPQFFSHPPRCSRGHGTMTRRQTQHNDNGNINRGYYACRRCPRKMIFDDWEGVRDGNPVCDCGELSRGQVELDRAYVFRCARGVCVYKEVLEEYEVDE